MPVDVHGSLISPFCRSVAVLAKKIGVDLNFIDPNVPEGGTKSEAFLQLNPFHTIPTLVEDGFTLFESRVIMAYLVSKYAPDSDLYPKDLQKRSRVDAMLHFDAGTLTASLYARGRSFIATGRDLGEAAQKLGEDHFKSLDLHLSRQKYAAGDNLTIADIAIVHTLTMAEVLDIDYSQYEHLDAYSKKVKEDLGDVYKEMNQSIIEITKERFNQMKSQASQSSETKTS